MSQTTATNEATEQAALDETVLSIQGVVKRFGSNIVLRGLDLDVRRHEVVVLLGASGSGKSTLLRCANLLERVDDGQIFLSGQDITDPSINADKIRAQIGVVFQHYNLFPHMSVIDNVTLAARKVHGWSPEEAAERGMSLLERIGLASKAREFPDLVREVKDGGSTILMATHEIGFARQVADRVVFLERGKIVEQGPPEEVIGNPKMPQTQEFLARVFH